MEYPQEHIYKLFLKKLTDTLTDEEYLFVQETLEKNLQARILLEELEAEFLEANSLKEFYENIDEEEASIDAPEEVEVPIYRKTSRILPKVIALIASLAAVIIIYFSVLRPKPNEKMESKRVISITLDSGESFDLSDPNLHQISIDDNTMISIDKNSLKVNLVNDAKEVYWATLQVPNGKTYSLVLSDGTNIYLNASSTLRFPLAFNGNKREVYADGEAFFNITRNPNHPFTTHTSKGDITVIGTEFNLRTYDSSFITSLIKGSVAVSHGDKMVILEPGEEAILDTFIGIRVTKFNIENSKSWTSGVYTFDNLPLAEVAKYIYRCYDLPVTFDRKETSTVTYTGYLDKSESIDSFLLSMDYIGIAFYTRNDTLHFR